MTTHQRQSTGLDSLALAATSSHQTQIQLLPFLCQVRGCAERFVTTDKLNTHMRLNHRLPVMAMNVGSSAKTPTPTRFLNAIAESMHTGSSSAASSVEVNPFNFSGDNNIDMQSGDLNTPAIIRAASAAASDMENGNSDGNNNNNNYNSGRASLQEVTFNRGSNNSDSKRSIDAGADDRGKRQRFLERNRAAASRCREKKRLWVQELEYKAERFESENIHLHSQITILIDEIDRLKGMLADHGILLSSENGSENGE